MRSADEALLDAVRGAIAVLEAELVGVAEPAGHHGLVRRDDVLRHVDVGRCAGPAVQELVSAADGVLDAPVVERERHRAGGMAEVPDHGNAVRVAVRGDRRDVVGRARSKIDVGEQDQRSVTVDRADDTLGLRQDEIEPLASNRLTSPSRM